jgi:hypothetical protein
MEHSSLRCRQNAHNLKYKSLSKDSSRILQFRGHPNHRGNGPWKDWAIIDWGGEGQLPSHIWCFVDLSGLPSGKSTIAHGGIDLRDGVYAVVEVAQYDEDVEEQIKSDLFTPLLVEVVGIAVDGEVCRKFYLANTDAIVGPCCVIPDIGGRKNAYFQAKSRTEWPKEFVSWLLQPHEHDTMEFADDELDEEKASPKEEEE